jgi:predicted transcriptional regulator
MKRALNIKEKAVLEVMSKPKIPSEIREQIGLQRKNSISPILKRLMASNLIYYLTPKARLGKLYGLTKKGIRFRKKLNCGAYCQPADINWKLYGWVVCGKQRKAILRAMGPPMPLRYIRAKAQRYDPRISRTNANDILRELVRKRLTLKKKEQIGVFFELTKKGQRIREQLCKP